MNAHEVWLAAGVRTPFARVDGALARLDAVELSLPVVRAMTGSQSGVKPDLVVWGTVIPNLGYSNIAREVQIEAGLDQTIPAFSTVLACSTSMVAAFEAAGMLGHGGKELALVGGVESMSRVQIGLSQNFSDWLRRFSQARSIAQRLALFKNLRARDGFPRPDTSLERLAKLQPAFDRKSGKGTITAGNASPLTDGAAGLWVATGAGIKRLPGSVPRARLVDWDVAALESASFRREKAGVETNPGEFPWERLNPHGGSVALGHPFGATGARILSQAVKELAAMPRGSRAVVSICADGGLGTVALLQAE